MSNRRLVTIADPLCIQGRFEFTQLLHSVESLVILRVLTHVINDSQFKCFWVFTNLLALDVLIVGIVGLILDLNVDGRELCSVSLLHRYVA